MQSEGKQKVENIAGKSEETKMTASDATEVTPTTGKVVEITISAKNWGFDPGEIHVKQGDKVKLTMKSISGTHAIAIPGLHVSSDVVHQGESVIVEFTADKKGTYDFKCSVPCGEGRRDMTGKLVVE